MSRHWPRVLLMSVDLVAGLVAALLAFSLRFDGMFPAQYLLAYAKALPVILPLRLLVYYGFGLYRHMWSHASLPELLRIVYAGTVDAAVSGVAILVFPGGFPRSVLIIGWFLNMAALGMIRLFLRVRHQRVAPRREGTPEPGTTLIFGAGDAGAMLAREIAKHGGTGANLLGFIDDDLQKQGYYVAGRPVLGTRADLATLVARHQIDRLIIAVPSGERSVIREVYEGGRELGLRVQTLPSLFEIVNGNVSLSQVRDVQIEDLLGREEIKVDLEAIAGYLTGEVVMVTGAGGSIGSELCRQVLRFGPRQLILVENGENNLYEIDMELRQRFPGVEIYPVIADVKDEGRIQQIFARFRPGVVFHAAAHKHVPMVERNPEEAIKTNIFGTLNVARAAHAYRARRFVLISSDKAVNPSSVMGATKRGAEYVIQSFAATSETIFVAVRFGNVLGSRGSVVPLFQKQIAAGGPVTITDPRMVRYFMTIPEAVELVIQAASMGHGGEIFVLDMGDPVKIVDLARDLIRLSGFEPDVDIPIVVTGIRAGEKLYEELLTAEEGTHATAHKRIFVARGDRISEGSLDVFLRTMQQMSTMGEQLRAQQVLSTVKNAASLGEVQDAAIGSLPPAPAPVSMPRAGKS